MPSSPPGAWMPSNGSQGPAYGNAPRPIAPARSPGTPWTTLLAVFAAGAALTGVGAVLYVHSARPSDENVSPTAPSTTPSTAPSTGSRGLANPAATPQNNAQQQTAVVPPQPAAQPAPANGIGVVHYQQNVEDPAAALGQPDRRNAVIRAGMLTLQMSTGHQLISDGTAAPDVRIEVDPTMPGPYRVEIGVGHNVFVLVADGVTGSREIDIDVAGVRVGRFVRVSTRASGASVALDAVLVREP